MSEGIEGEQFESKKRKGKEEIGVIELEGEEKTIKCWWFSFPPLISY